MSSRLLSISILGILFLAVFSMNALAQEQIGNSSLYAFPDGDHDIEIHLEEEATHVWSICNTGNEGYYVAVALVETDSDFDAEVAPTHFDFPANQSEDGCKDVALTVMAPSIGEEEDVQIGINITATDLGTLLASTETLWTMNRLTGVTHPDDPEGKIMGTFDNFLPAPLDTPIGAFILTLLIWVALALLVVAIANGLARTFASETETKVDDMIVELMKGPIFLIILLYGLQFSMPVGGIDSSQIPFLDGILGMFLIGLLTWVAYKVFKDVLVYYGKILSVRTQTDLDDRLIPVISKMGGLLIVIFGAIAIFGSFGYDIALFLTGLGFLGIVIGFAAGPSLSNFFAGIFLLLDRPFKRGDLIELGSGEICRVAWVGLRSTKLYHIASHQMITLPNTKLAEEKVVNITLPDERIKGTVMVGVAYGTDLDLAKRTLFEIVESHPSVLKGDDVKPAFRVTEFADSSINLKMIFWVDDVNNKWRVESELKELIDKRFKAESIDIPFPQRVVYLHQETKM
jgi:MscS family membrane protein